MKKYYLIGLFIILIIACFFRLWQISELPAGLFPDEAANGQDALLILKGYHTPFFERGLGREALYFYLLAGSIGVFGIGVWQIHIISAAIGILTVLSTWFLAKELFNKRVAFLTSFFLAASTWHTTLSRTGFRGILVPLFSTLFFYFSFLVVRAKTKKKRILFAILSGASLGLGFYTYISFRVIIGIIGIIGIILLFAKKGIIKKFWREIVFGSIAALIILCPLIIYFINHPLDFVGRTGCVSIFNPDLNKGNILKTFLGVCKQTFFMFFTNGDLNWRHNVSGYSMINPLTASFFALGFLYSLLIVLKSLFKKNPSSKNFFNRLFSGQGLGFKHLFLIICFLAMLLPQVLTAESIPHGLRSIGVIPVVFFFPALIIDLFWKKTNISKTVRFSFTFLLGLITIISLSYNYFLYFNISANSPGFYYAYRSDLTMTSKYLNERHSKENTYLVLDEYSVQTVDFLTAKNNQPYVLVDPALSYQTELNPNDQIIFTQSTIFDTRKFEQYHSDVKLVKQGFNQFGEEILKIYEQ